jgi:hypothetical protein
MPNAQPDRERHLRSVPRTRKPPRPNPAALYPPPPGCGWQRLSNDDLTVMDAPALSWELRRVKRALAAFTAAERRSAYGTREFDGSARNPILALQAAYPYLLSDYLQEREGDICGQLRRRGEEGQS